MPLAAYSALALHETIVLIQTPSFGIKHEETVTKTLNHCIREPCSSLYGKALNLLVNPPKSTYHTTEPQPCVFPDQVSGKVFTLVFISCLISKTTIYLLPNVFSAETRAATSHLLRRPFLGLFRKMPVDYVTKRKWLTRHSHLLVLFI